MHSPKPPHNQPVASATRWDGLRLALCVLVALVVAVMALCAVSLVRAFDARTQAQVTAHQTTEVDLWARMLTARMEVHQRLLASIAQGLHTSLLDTPAVLDALMQQEGSILRLFDSLHMALPTGEMSHHGAVGAAAEIDVQGMEAMRRTIATGKPLITHIPTPGDGEYLRLLLSVPMRAADGHVSGALAAVVKLSVAALLPEGAAPQKHVQYMVLGADGSVLLHSDATQRGKSIQSVLGGAQKIWPALSNASAVNADTLVWGHRLVSRVGLPLPQWQVVVVREMSADWWQPTDLSAAAWGGLAGGAVLLTALAAWLLWGWLAPWPVKGDGAERGDGQEVEDARLALGNDCAPQVLLQAGAGAMFDALPFAMLLEQGRGVKLATPQVAVMLGYFDADSTPPPLEQLFESTEVLAEVRHALVEIGSFEGRVRLRKKDGDGMVVDVWAWVPSQLPDAVVWRLQLPWRQRRAMPLPESQHLWRDALTGMPNREALVWDLQAWVSDSLQPDKKPIDAASRVPAQGCLLFADVDHLGMMNETTSRALGDKILRHAGHLVVSYTQPLGRAARIGGDEFAVLLPGISLAHAQGIGQALCDAVAHWQPSWGGERHWVSLSVGVVAVDATRHTPQQALHAADMACYEAKRRGRCQVAVGQITVQPSQPVTSKS